MRTSEQSTALIAALVAARSAFQPIHKNATAQAGRDRPFPYADLSAVLEAVIPALTANGLVLLQSLDAETSSLITRLVHTSGEWVDSVYPLPTTADPRAFGSTLTYGRRYSIQSLLCLAAEDNDGSAATTPTKTKGKTEPNADDVSISELAARLIPKVDKVITQPQQKRLFTMATKAGWNHDQIRSYLHRIGINSTTEIRVSQYDAIIDTVGTPYEPFIDPMEDPA